MTTNANVSFSSDRMSLSGELDFATVVSVEPAGSQWLREQAPKTCTLDMSGVTRSNSAGTALLLAWLRAAIDAGKSLHIEHPPESLCALLQLGGLDKVLGADTVTLPPGFFDAQQEVVPGQAGS